jgi:SAM-dependent methyltransferase
MHDLPWDDESFDVVTSFRGIWGANDQAVVEAARVLKPGGTLAVTFLPMDEPAPFDQWWVSIAKVSDHEKEVGQILGSIGSEGRVEEMCEAAGLVPGERQRIRFEFEGGPEVEDFVRASLSAGPTYTAVQERGQDDVEDALRRDFTPLWDEALGLRIGVVVEYLVATKPT